jgi:D-serine deaminase-like pyridoxal phosphate-dependent protein
MDAKRWIIAAIAAAAAAAALAAWLLLAHRGTDGAENGLFANDCCGTVRLESGTLALNDSQKVRYTIARDGAGAYVLPAYYVGAVEDQGFEVDGTRPALKLRLDRMPHPSRLVLYAGRISYIFTRKAAPPPRR